MWSLCISEPHKVRTPYTAKYSARRLLVGPWHLCYPTVGEFLDGKPNIISYQHLLIIVTKRATCIWQLNWNYLINLTLYPLPKVLFWYVNLFCLQWNKIIFADIYKVETGEIVISFKTQFKCHSPWAFPNLTRQSWSHSPQGPSDTPSRPVSRLSPHCTLSLKRQMSSSWRKKISSCSSLCTCTQENAQSIFNTQLFLE